MPYCSVCGHQYKSPASFCSSCGSSLSPASSLNQSNPERRNRTGSLRTTTMVLGLIAATLLLLGGCVGFVTGSAALSLEEAFDTKISDSSDGVTSTTEDVANAGAFAVLISIFLFLGSELAKVALRTSLALLVITLPMLIGLVATDTTSLFAATYYLAIILTGTEIALMFLAYRRSKSNQSPNPSR